MFVNKVSDSVCVLNLFLAKLASLNSHVVVILAKTGDYCMDDLVDSTWGMNPGA